MSTINKTTIMTALPESGRGTWRDPGTSGLELVGRKDQARWYVRHRVGGKRIRDKIEGLWPVIGLGAARKAAKHIVERAATTNAAGGDYARNRADARIERARLRSAPTIAEVLDTYARKSLSGQRTGAEAERILRGIVDPLLARKAHEVSVGDIRKQVEAKRETAPAAADAAMRRLKPFWRWLAERGHAEHILGDVRVDQTNVRERVLTKAELGRVVNTLTSYGDTAGALCAQAIVLTAQRRQEVQNMRTSELHLGEREWHIPSARAKNARAHIVHLSDAAVKLVERAMVLSGGHNLVFLGQTGSTAFNGWGKLKARVDRDSGVSDWRWHDLRRCFASGCVDAGVNAQVADRVLNHIGAGTSSTVARIYQRSEMSDQRRAAMDAWAEYVAYAQAMASGESAVEISHA